MTVTSANIPLVEIFPLCKHDGAYFHESCCVIAHTFFCHSCDEHRTKQASLSLSFRWRAQKAQSPNTLTVPCVQSWPELCI